MIMRWFGSNVSIPAEAHNQSGDISLKPTRTRDNTPMNDGVPRTRRSSIFNNFQVTQHHKHYSSTDNHISSANIFTADKPKVIRCKYTPKYTKASPLRRHNKRHNRSVWQNVLDHFSTHPTTTSKRPSRPCCSFVSQGAGDEQFEKGGGRDRTKQ